MSLPILVWNVRGIGNDPTSRHVKLLCRNHNTLILAILEPMSGSDFHLYCRKLGFYFGVSNHNNKIWVFWKKCVTRQVLSDNAQSIDMQFSSPIFPTSFSTSFIYAKSTRIERRDLWNDLRTSAQSFTNMPWLVGGDFNCFLAPEERIGSNTNRNQDMIEFGQMISDVGLVDAGFEGNSMHTWFRNNLMERLDRILLNGPWDDLFAKSSSPISLEFTRPCPFLFHASLTIIKTPMAFRYMKMWARHPSFLPTLWPKV
ncbi:hypothetical protein DH2020_040408 [Rehmannia glutinosa]|uniref:Endonuclease/exonuclease/phosphatase domain-containing protein n=1 Tax=Rehmannia glutinosa TaxID=99300 RepID=A0ABR0UU83_REHGL